MSAGDYVNGSVFVVNISGTELGFSKISGIGQTAEFDTYVEGGGVVHMLPKPKTQAGTLTFEKGVSVLDKRSAEIFTSGATLTDIQISLVKNGKTAENYYIERALVVSWQLGELDALSSKVAVKSFQIAHTGLRRI